MSVFELFRRFFHPPGMRDPFFGGMTLEEDDYDDDEEDDYEEDVLPPSWRGASPHHDPFGFKDIFQDFHKLFSDFGSMTLDVPRLPGVEPPTRAPGRSGTDSARDFMLKYPDSHLPGGPSEGPDRSRWLPRWDDAISAPPGGAKQDKSLDSEVSSHGLDSVLRPTDPAPLMPSAYCRSVSVSRVLRADGSVEERRTVRDSDGNATSTVTVTRGEPAGSGHPAGAALTNDDSTLPSHPDLSDSQTILSRILRRWLSD